VYKIEERGMEEIVGGTISFLLRVFVWIIIDLLFDIVCWGLGWAVPSYSG